MHDAGGHFLLLEMKKLRNANTYIFTSTVAVEGKEQILSLLLKELSVWCGRFMVGATNDGKASPICIHNEIPA